jgi:hypothetical protein
MFGKPFLKKQLFNKFNKIFVGINDSWYFLTLLSEVSDAARNCPFTIATVPKSIIPVKDISDNCFHL